MLNYGGVLLRYVYTCSCFVLCIIPVQTRIYEKTHFATFFNTFFSLSDLLEYYLRPSSLSIVVTQIRGHIAGSSPRALHFYREKISVLFLPSSTRSRLFDCVLTHAINDGRFHQSILFFFANKFKISPRRGSNSRTNTTTAAVVLVAFEGYHY